MRRCLGYSISVPYRTATKKHPLQDNHARKGQSLSLSEIVCFKAGECKFRFVANKVLEWRLF